MIRIFVYISNMQKEVKVILSLSLAVILLVILFIIFGSKQGGPTTDISKLVDGAIHMTGKAGAKATIVEFGDFECPACGQFNAISRQLIDVYGKNPEFNFVFRNFPLPQHKNAFIAAEAAEAAGEQWKYWEMESLLYENQGEWVESEAPIDIFVKYANQIGLDSVKFKSEVLASKYKDIITKDLALGSEIGISWTPSIYVNGELLQTMPSLDELKSKIDSSLK